VAHTMTRDGKMKAHARFEPRASMARGKAHSIVTAADSRAQTMLTRAESARPRSLHSLS